MELPYLASRLSLLPRFRAERLEAQSGEHEGLVRLYGSFLEPVGAEAQSTYFYLPDLRSVYGFVLASPRQEPLRCFEQFWASDIEQTELLNVDLSYFGAYDERQLRLAIDPAITWHKCTFASSQALASRFVGTDGKFYRKLEHFGGVKSNVPESSQIVQDGWNHEHCIFCGRHIDPGDTGFRSGNDWDDEWAYSWCYRNAIEPHDLRPLLIPYLERR